MPYTVLLMDGIFIKTMLGIGDETDTAEDLPKTKNLTYILVMMLIEEQSYLSYASHRCKKMFYSEGAKHNQLKSDVRSLCIVQSTTSLQSMLKLGGSAGMLPRKFEN